MVLRQLTVGRKTTTFSLLSPKLAIPTLWKQSCHRYPHVSLQRRVTSRKGMDLCLEESSKNLSSETL
jgi:hypothetical protein